MLTNDREERWREIYFLGGWGQLAMDKWQCTIDNGQMTMDMGRRV